MSDERHTSSCNSSQQCLLKEKYSSREVYVIFLPPSSTQLQFPVHLKAVIVCQSIHGWEKISLEIAEAVIFILRQRGVLLEA